MTRSERAFYESNHFATRFNLIITKFRIWTIRRKIMKMSRKIRQNWKTWNDDDDEIDDDEEDEDDDDDDEEDGEKQ